MIPKVVPPLTGLSVLVTRPAAQSQRLCTLINAAGGDAIAFPTLEIEPVAAEVPGPCDLVIFLSVNAVAHGAHLLPRPINSRIAAIGKATAAALAAAEIPADIVPPSGFTSEALLAHPELELAAGSRILLVRGVGGRELLHQTFTSRDMVVETREVYRRVRPQLAPEQILALEARWIESGLDAVTLTSVETLHNLMAILSDRGNELLRKTTLVVSSSRIGAAATEAGCRGEIIVATSPDDHSTLGALALRQTRARMPRG